MRIFSIQKNINNYPNIKSNVNQTTTNYKNQNIKFGKINQTDTYTANKEQLPKEIKDTIKNFITTNDNAEQCNEALTKKSADIFTLANEIITEAYKAQSYAAKVYKEIMSSNVWGFFENGNEIDIDGKLVKKYTRNKNDNSIRIDYFKSNGQIEKTAILDKSRKYLEITEGEETAPDGSKKIEKRYLYNAYTGTLEQYEEGIEYHIDGSKKINKQIDTSKLFDSANSSFTYRKKVEELKDGTVASLQSLYYKINNEANIRNPENEENRPMTYFIYKEGQEQGVDGSSWTTRQLCVSTTPDNKVSGFYKECERNNPKGSQQIFKHICFADKYQPEFYHEQISKSTNGIETIGKAISYEDGQINSYREGIRYDSYGSNEKIDKSLSFVMNEIVYYKERIENINNIMTVGKAIRKTPQGWKNVTDIVSN